MTALVVAFPRTAAHFQQPPAVPAHEEARTCILNVVNAMFDYLTREGDNSPERRQVEAILREAQKRLRQVRMERVAAAAILARLKEGE